MSPRRKLIDLNDYGQKGKDLKAFRIELNSRLIPEIFSFDSIQELYYEALKHIKPVNKTVKNDDRSIQLGIIKVVDHFFGNRRRGKLYKLSSDGLKTPVETKRHDENPKKSFQIWILGFEEAPKKILKILKPNVEQDLRDVNDLIKFYEGLEEVKDFLSTRKVRPSHRSKTILDFYSRCQEDRQKILDYYLEGVYERSIEKARAHIFPGFGLKSLDFWKDYPYEFGRYPYGRALDFREIDCVSHRLSDIPVSHGKNLKKWYKEDKERFYKEYFKLRTVDRLFENISKNNDYLPMTNYRGHIFDELRNLFKKKQWLPFYALALPQVEGLFTEMLNSANPKIKASTDSLTKKVKLARPIYDLSDVYFDYYEYELANQRNSFSHSGIVKDPRTKACDILVDLEHILSVYASLENPHVAIYKILRAQRPEDFSDFKGFAQYFDLLDSLPTEHKSEPSLKNSLNDFNQRFLRNECSIENVVRHAEANMDFGISDLWEKCQSSIPEFTNIGSWEKINKPKLKKLLLNESFEQNCEGFFRIHEEEVSMAVTLKVFFEGVKKYVYNDQIPEDLQSSFESWNSHKSFVRWLMTFKSLINMQH